MVAGLHRGNTCPNLAHNACALMAQNGRKNTFAVETIQRVSIRMTNTRRHDFHQHLAGLWPFEIKLHNL